jgi:16S rRNA G966 N2-methylase RsmD
MKKPYGNNSIEQSIRMTILKEKDIIKANAISYTEMHREKTPTIYNGAIDTQRARTRRTGKTKSSRDPIIG